MATQSDNTYEYSALFSDGRSSNYRVSVTTNYFGRHKGSRMVLTGKAKDTGEPTGWLYDDH